MATNDPQNTRGNQPNREQLFQMAVKAAQDGKRQGARMMFSQILTEDRTHERAMLWMAKLAAKPEDKRKWLHQVLEINPDNERARKTLDKMAYREAASRNRALFRIALGAGAILVLVVNLAYLFSVVAAGS